jgi:hypothetical protein
MAKCPSARSSSRTSVGRGTERRVRCQRRRRHRRASPARRTPGGAGGRVDRQPCCRLVSDGRRPRSLGGTHANSAMTGPLECSLDARVHALQDRARLRERDTIAVYDRGPGCVASLETRVGKTNEWSLECEARAVRRLAGARLRRRRRIAAGDKGVTRTGVRRRPVGRPGTPRAPPPASECRAPRRRRPAPGRR